MSVRLACNVHPFHTHILPSLHKLCHAVTSGCIFYIRSVKNEKLLRRVKEERNILHTIKRRGVDWISYILRKNCLLQNCRSDRTERSWERRRKQLLDDFKKTRRYGELKEEALGSTVCRTRFGIGYGPVVRQTVMVKKIRFDLPVCLLSCMDQKGDL